MPLEIRRISFNSPAVDALLQVMDAEMGALYADVPELRDPKMLRLVEVALTVHPEDMIVSVGAFDGDQLVGHATVRAFADALEVKRVYVLQEYRGRGISKALMAELETIARERNVSRLILQTGDRQVEAIALYTQLGYVPIDRFGAYEPVPFFLCYGKTLSGPSTGSGTE